MPIEKKRKKFIYNFCQECGRPLKKDRHGSQKFCSELCVAMYRRKYRRDWFQRKQARIKAAKKGYRAGLGKKYDNHNNTKPDSTELE